MFDDVLVPTDGSTCAETAVGYAEDLAEHYEATVHVLCVVDARILENAPHYDRLREESTEIVHTAHDQLATADHAVTEAVRSDVPYRGILQYVTEEDIDLVVMGTHGRTGVERYLLGSVTEKVVRLSDAPVLTVRSKEGERTYPYTDVLVPTDGSEAAAAAIGPSVNLASTYGARLHALSVVDTMTMGIDVRSARLLDPLEETAREGLEQVEKQASRASVSTVRTTIEHGSPYREIRSYVDEHGIDLVVMGTHGRSSIERYLLGSIAEKTVRTSSVPVMTVRQPASE